MANPTHPAPKNVLVLLGFLTHSLTHLEPSVIALIGAGLAIGVSRLDPEDYLQDVEWETLLFFVGLCPELRDWRVTVIIGSLVVG